MVMILVSYNIYKNKTTRRVREKERKRGREGRRREEREREIESEDAPWYSFNHLDKT